MGLTFDTVFSGIFKGKRVLITGDTGFKGSWLAIWLKEMGAQVYGYALPPKSDAENFPLCSLDARIQHRNGDIRDREALQQFFTEVQPELAFHLAAQAIVLDSYEQPHYTFETNVIGVVNFFEAVRNTPSVKAAVNVTSDKCYQNNEWVWGYRETDPMGGHDPYSASKGCSELITQSYIRSFFSRPGSCAVASARAGNVIGGGDHASYRIVPDFFRAVAGNKKLVIRNPEAVRPWQHLLEPLGGYLLLASKLYTEGAAFSGGWNFGPVETNCATVRVLIESIIGAAKTGANEVPASENAPHEATLLKLDISKANALLNWRPSLSFEETIGFTVTGYLDEMHSPENLYEKRVDQIKAYVEKTIQNNAS